MSLNSGSLSENLMKVYEDEIIHLVKNMLEEADLSIPWEDKKERLVISIRNIQKVIRARSKLK